MTETVSTGSWDGNDKRTIENDESKGANGFESKLGDADAENPREWEKDKAVGHTVVEIDALYSG